MAVFLSCQHFGLVLQVFCFLYNYFKGWILWDVELAGLSTLKVQPFFFHDAWVTSFTQPLHRHGSISQHCPERLSLRKTFSLPASPVLGFSAATANKLLLNTFQTAVTFSPQFIIMQNWYSAVNPWFIIMQNRCSVAGMSYSLRAMSKSLEFEDVVMHIS